MLPCRVAGESASMTRGVYRSCCAKRLAVQNNEATPQAVHRSSEAYRMNNHINHIQKIPVQSGHWDCIYMLKEKERITHAPLVFPRLDGWIIWKDTCAARHWDCTYNFTIGASRQASPRPRTRPGSELKNPTECNLAC